MLLTILIAGLLLVAVVGGVAALLEYSRTGTVRGVKRRLHVLGGRWGGSAIILVGLTLWFLYGPLARQVEPIDGQDGAGLALMDIGVFQTLLLAGIRAVALYCFSLLLVRQYWSPVARFLKRHFIRAFYRLTEWQKIIVSLWVVSLFVFLSTQLTR